MQKSRPTYVFQILCTCLLFMCIVATNGIPAFAAPPWTPESQAALHGIWNSCTTPAQGYRILVDTTKNKVMFRFGTKPFGHIGMVRQVEKSGNVYSLYLDLATGTRGKQSMRMTFAIQAENNAKVSLDGGAPMLQCRENPPSQVPSRPSQPQMRSVENQQPAITPAPADDIFP